MNRASAFIVSICLGLSASAQDLVPYTDSINRFTISVPQWTALPQDSGSSIKLYLYDSSSAVECTAQTYLSLKISGKAGSTPHARRKDLPASANADSTRGRLAGGATWTIRQDSVICRPGELDHKIQKQFVIFTYHQKPYTATLTCTATDLKAMLPLFLSIAESLRFF